MIRLRRSLADYEPVHVGLAGALVITLAVLGTFAISSLSLGDVRYTAEFANTGGIDSGDEVRVAGIGVGEVTDVELAGDHILVEFSVSSDVEVGSESRVEIKLATLLGTRYLELRPSGSEELADNRIPLRHTSVPFDIQHLIETGAPDLEALDSQRLSEAMQVVADAFRDTPKAAGDALDGLSRISAVILEREDQVNRLIVAATDVTGTLDSNSQQLFALMGQADTLLRELDARRELIHQVLTDSTELGRQLIALVGENQAQIGPMLRNLETVTEILQRKDKQIARSLKALAPAARYMANATGDGPYINGYLPSLVIPDNVLCAVGVVKGCR